jgi:hypothetical protein
MKSAHTIDNREKEKSTTRSKTPLRKEGGKGKKKLTNRKTSSIAYTNESRLDIEDIEQGFLAKEEDKIQTLITGVIIISYNYIFIFPILFPFYIL